MSEYRLEHGHDAIAVPKRVALIRRETPARVLESREEVLMTAPHLLVREIILIQVCVIVLAVVSLLFDAPLEGIADPSNTPNPTKAPWYFLGLQELLHYFPPVVAGVLLPSLAVIGIVVIPYFRVNLDVAGFYERPWRRNLAITAGVAASISAFLAAYRVWAALVPTLAFFVLMSLPAWSRCPAALRRSLARVPLSDWIMSWFVAVATILTLIGVFFRGPGWIWVWPWQSWRLP